MRRIEFFTVQQTDLSTGHRDEVRLTRIDEKMLSRKQDFVKCFNVPMSTVDNMFAEGTLTRYHANGQVKTGSGKSATYIDVKEFLAADLNHQQPIREGVLT